MSDDALRRYALTTIYSLFKARKASTPISSIALLALVISYKPPTSIPSAPRLRLTDLTRFESILDSLAQPGQQDQISLVLAQNDEELTVMDVILDRPPAGQGSGVDASTSRKRKRVIDEDADSAAGDDEGDEEEPVLVQSPLAGLSKEMKEAYNILQKGTAKGRLLAEQYRSLHETFEPVCEHITKDACAKSRLLSSPSSIPSICPNIHFRPLIRPHTDVTLGHCSYLNTCYSEPTYLPGSAPTHAGGRGAVSLPNGLGAGGRGKEKAPCRYLHFEVDWDDGDAGGMSGRIGGTGGAAAGASRDVVQRGTIESARAQEGRRKPHMLGIGMGPDGQGMRVLPPQWINCDLRRFDYSVLGKFHIIMADPPWDIHMSLPYGTMTDDEMRAMPIPMLQDEGFIFLWVTGRAMEVGRECLRFWGYTRVDEVVWVKTNQLQRVIRTGRTGHWLNHTKEHMLVGLKTPSNTSADPSVLTELKWPRWANRGLDTDVIVSEVRETSRKPDEVYGMIERVCPGGRKVEIFGRRHNVRPGWLTLGNQLGTDQIYEEDLAARIRARYPERVINVPNSMPAEE